MKGIIRAKYIDFFFFFSAQVFYKLKDYASAIRLTNQSILMRAYDPKAFSQLGQIYEAIENFKEAEAAYQLASNFSKIDIHSKLVLCRKKLEAEPEGKRRKTEN